MNYQRRRGARVGLVTRGGSDADTEQTMASTAIPKNTKSRFTAEIFSAQTDDAAIAPLLSRAHLLKTRGQWEEAVAVCTDAVRRSPISPSPYALLGDIYNAQNKTDDALHWYRMALERNPNLPGIKTKHDTLFAAKRATATGSFAAATLAADRTARLPATNRATSGVQAPPSDRITAERTLEWLDRVFPPGRSEGMTRLLIAIGAAVGLLVVVSTVFLFSTFNKADAVGEDAPAPVVNAVMKPADLSEPSPSPAQSGDTAATPVPSLKDRLTALSGGLYSVTAAQSNLKNHQVQLEIALVSLPGETPDSTRARILRASAAVAEAAFGLEPTVQRFLVRVILQTGSTNTANGSLVFVGETSSVALNTLRTAFPIPDNALLAASFTNVWWSVGLRRTAL